MSGAPDAVPGLNLRLCVQPGCLTRIPLPRIFCGRHWAFIPDRLQQEIGNAWISGYQTRLEVLVARAKSEIIMAERREQRID